MPRSITYHTQAQITAAIERHRTGEGMTHLQMQELLEMKQGAYSLRRKAGTGWKFKQIQILKKKGILK